MKTSRAILSVILIAASHNLWAQSVNVGPLTNPSSVASARQTCATSAAALPTLALVNGVAVKALAANVTTVYVGGPGVTTSTGYPLAPGEAISYGASNQNGVYLVCSNATDIVAFTGN